MHLESKKHLFLFNVDSKGLSSWRNFTDNNKVIMCLSLHTAYLTYQLFPFEKTPSLKILQFLLAFPSLEWMNRWSGRIKPLLAASSLYRCIPPWRHVSSHHHHHHHHQGLSHMCRCAEETWHVLTAGSEITASAQVHFRQKCTCLARDHNECLWLTI